MRWLLLVLACALGNSCAEDYPLPVARAVEPPADLRALGGDLFGSCINCNGQCADFTSDPTNCGGCGKLCPAAAAGGCLDGVCVCGHGIIVCNGVCARLYTDPNNCGACGNKCPNGIACVDGKCVGCLSGLTDCNGTCVDLQYDPNNCGACGKSCPPGNVCHQHLCL